MDYSRFYGSSRAAAGLTAEYDPGWAGNGVLPFEAEAAQKAREAAARRMRKNAFMQGQPDQERLDALNASAPEMMPPAVMSAPVPGDVPATAPTDAPASFSPPMQAAGPDSVPSATPTWLGILNGAPLDYPRPSPPAPTGAYGQADQADAPAIPPTSSGRRSSSSWGSSTTSGRCRRRPRWPGRCSPRWCSCSWA